MNHGTVLSIMVLQIGRTLIWIVNRLKQINSDYLTIHSPKEISGYFNDTFRGTFGRSNECPLI